MDKLYSKRFLKAARSIFSQGHTREWAAQQRAQLDSLAPLAADSQALLAAAAETEAAPAAKVSPVPCDPWNGSQPGAWTAQQSPFPRLVLFSESSQERVLRMKQHSGLEDCALTTGPITALTPADAA